jgi:CBS domain-containing protein
MKARKIMSSGADCVGADETLESAARRLAAAGVGSMPICGEDDRLKGMLTDRDIVVKAVARGKDLTRTMVGNWRRESP